MGVIESGFGDLVPFNKVVRGLRDRAIVEGGVPEDLDNATFRLNRFETMPSYHNVTM